MRYILSTIIATHSTVASRHDIFDVPIVYDEESNIPRVVVSMPMQGIVGRNFALTMADGTLIEYVPGRDDRSKANRYTVSFPETVGDRIFTYSDSGVVPHSAGAGMYLGVGPESSVVQTYGSVNVLRGIDEETGTRNDRMIVGLGLDGFLEECSAEHPMIRIPFTNNIDFPSTYAALGLLEFVVPSSFRGPVAEPVPTYVSLQSFEKVRLSRYLADKIAINLQQFGGRQDAADTDLFTDCDWDLGALLPHIRLHFHYQGTREWDTVTVSLIPDDYLIVNEEARTCRLIAYEDERDMLGLNPLMFTSMNVRIAPKGVGLCFPK